MAGELLRNFLQMLVEANGPSAPAGATESPESPAQMIAQQQSASTGQPVNRIDLNVPPGITGVSGPAGATEPAAVPEQALLASKPGTPPAVSLPAPRDFSQDITLTPVENTDKAGDMGGGGSSQQKNTNPKPAAREQTQEIAAATQKAAADTPDDRLTALNAKQHGLEKERMDALDKAAHAGDMSPGEMIAMALITLLPTIVGGAAGGAVGGKAGAAAGVAGGLTGASQGFQGVLAGKDKAKEQALAQAAQAAGRGDKIDAEVLNRQDQLDRNKQFGQKLSQDQDQFGKKLSADKAIAAAHNATQLKVADKSMYATLKAHEMDNSARLLKAEQKAEQAALGGGATGEETNAMRYAARMIDSEPLIRRHSKELASVGSLVASKEGWLRAMADPNTRKAADAAGRFFASIMRKESGAAIGEHEWATNYMRYMPMLNDSQDEIEAKQHAREVEVRSMSYSAGRARPLIMKILEGDTETPAGGAQQQQQQQSAPGGYVEWHP